MGCGRIRKSTEKNRLTWLVDGEMKDIRSGVIDLEKGHSVEVSTADYEYGFVLIHGQFCAKTSSGDKFITGIRHDFHEKPFGLLITKEETVTLTALEDSLIGVGAAPAADKYRNKLITQEEVGGGQRGKDNWSRSVNFIIWTDNTKGNMLMMGETIIPSGNWSTFPPHRHDYKSDDEVPYNEIYYYRFERPSGAGLLWQFDDDNKMDNAYSVKNGDSIYMDKGYHPLTCMPGCDMYQLTIMSGSYRQSKAKLHPDYTYILEENKMNNPYAYQMTKE
jgi:5-deoxy-glucuronate isomerase